MRGLNLQVVRARVDRLVEACQPRRRAITLEELVVAANDPNYHLEVAPDDPLVALICGGQRNGGSDAR
jgi:hypothetical protein